MTTQNIHPFCNVCGWRKGGPDSWDGRACKCGHSEPPMSTELIEAIDEQLRKGESQFIRNLEKRSMSTWSNEELAEYSRLTGQSA